MALTNEEILDAIASKTVLEISELIKMMEDKFGVSLLPLLSLSPLLALLPLPRPKKRPNLMWFLKPLARTRSPRLRLFAN